MENKKWFIIKGLGPQLDGLLVQGEHKLIDLKYVHVYKIVNRDVFIGDRLLSCILPDEGMYLNSKYLEETVSPENMEFDSKNPWGNTIEEFKQTLGNIHVVWVEYERCLQVSILEKDKGTKTLFTCNYFTGFDDIKKAVRDHLPNDVEDLIFVLRNWKEGDQFVK